MTSRSERRKWTRRRADKRWDRIQRGSLGVLIVLYLVGFNSGRANDEKIRALTAQARALAVESRHLTAANCGSIHKVVVALGSIVKGSRPRLVLLKQEGTLTTAQLRRALRDNTKQQRTLSKADCP